MLGSSETTFYTISVYFGAAGVKNALLALPAALIADLTGFCMAALSVRVFLGNADLAASSIHKRLAWEERCSAWQDAVNFFGTLRRSRKHFPVSV